MVRETNRESDLLRAFQGGIEGFLSGFDVAVDVFDHHDGVVHDEAGGDGQGHQGEIIQAVAKQIHRAERSHQRKRHGHARNHGGGNAAEEQENDHDDERHGEHQLEFDVFHRSADRRRAVGQNRHLHGGGQGAGQRGSSFLMRSTT